MVVFSQGLTLFLLFILREGDEKIFKEPGLQKMKPGSFFYRGVQFHYHEISKPFLFPKRVLEFKGGLYALLIHNPVS